MMKRFLALSVCVMLLLSVLSGCSILNNTPSDATEPETHAPEVKATEAPAPATGDSEEPDSDDEDDLPTLPDMSGVLQDEMTGTGDNASLPLSITLFGTEYTAGKSTLQDMFDQDWGKDPESWENIDLNAPVAKDEVGGSFLTMDKMTTEAMITYKNLAKESALPKECIITMIDFKGAPNGGLKKAGVKCFGSKLNLSQVTSVDTIDEQLSAILSTYKKGKLSLPVYNFYYYTVELNTGKVRIDITEKKETGEISRINVQLDLDSDYVYAG